MEEIVRSISRDNPELGNLIRRSKSLGMDVIGEMRRLGTSSDRIERGRGRERARRDDRLRWSESEAGGEKEEEERVKEDRPLNWSSNDPVVGGRKRGRDDLIQSLDPRLMRFPRARTQMEQSTDGSEWRAESSENFSLFSSAADDFGSHSAARTDVKARVRRRSIRALKRAVDIYIEIALDKKESHKVEQLSQFREYLDEIDGSTRRFAPLTPHFRRMVHRHASVLDVGRRGRRGKEESASKGEEESSFDTKDERGISESKEKEDETVQVEVMLTSAQKDLLHSLPSPDRPAQGPAPLTEAKEESTMECPICYDTFPLASLASIRSCSQHFYCHTCLSTHINTLIDDIRTATAITCPYPGCPAQVEEDEVHFFASPKQYEKFLDFAARAILTNETNLRWCPVKSCSTPVIWDVGEKKVVCPTCRYAYCFDCLKAWHEGMECGARREKGGGDGGAGGAVSKEDDESDLQFEKWMKEKGAKVKLCPRCRFPTEKNAGCNHMTCVRCRMEWCWLCTQEYTPDHFEEGKCGNLQFVEGDTVEEAEVGRRARNRKVALGLLALYPYFGIMVMVSSGVAAAGTVVGYYHTIVPATLRRWGWGGSQVEEEE